MRRLRGRANPGGPAPATPTSPSSFASTPTPEAKYSRRPTPGAAQIVPGLSLHYEMQMLADMGITPTKAIQGATLWAAEVIGQDKDLGSVEPGKLADFVIVDGDPLRDIGATRNVRTVIKGGEVIDSRYDPKWVNPIPRRPASTGK